MNRHDVGQLLVGRIQFNYSCKWVRCFDYHLLKHFLCNFSGGAQSFPDPTFKLNKYHGTFRYSCTMYMVGQMSFTTQNIAVRSFSGTEKNLPFGKVSLTLMRVRGLISCVDVYVLDGIQVARHTISCCHCPIFMAIIKFNKILFWHTFDLQSFIQQLCLPPSFSRLMSAHCAFQFGLQFIYVR